MAHRDDRKWFQGKIWRCFLIFFAMMGYSQFLLVIGIVTVLTPVLSVRLHRRLYLFVMNGYSQLFSFLQLLLNIQVFEAGDELEQLGNDHVLMICNHQTNFDWVYCFILLLQLNKLVTVLTAVRKSQAPSLFLSTLEMSGCYLHHVEEPNSQETFKKYLTQSFFNKFDAFLIFPEAGISKNQLEKSHKYAKEHGLPVYKNVATPRWKGVHFILSTIGETLQEARNENFKEKRIKWILDLTTVITKPEASYSGNFTAKVQNAKVFIIKKLYAVKDIPRDEEEFQQWLYARFEEKDRILEHVKMTGELPPEVTNYTSNMKSHSPRWYFPAPPQFAFLLVMHAYQTIWILKLISNLFFTAVNAVFG